MDLGFHKRGLLWRDASVVAACFCLVRLCCRSVKICSVSLGKNMCLLFYKNEE